MTEPQQTDQNKTSPLLKVAVIGAGPVGRAAAAALAAVEGVSVTVFEKAARATHDSTATGCNEGSDDESKDARALEIWPNAVAALERIFVSKSVGPRKSLGELLFGNIKDANYLKDANYYRLERYDFRSPTGRLLWGAPTGAIGRRLGRHPHVMTPKQLKDRLKDATETANGITYAYDHELSKVDLNKNDAHPVKLTFSHGHSDSFDLVVAADGGTSSVRRLTTGFSTWSPRRSRVLAIVGRTPKSPVHGLTSKGIGFVTHIEDARFGAWACPAEPTKAVRWLALVPAIDLFKDEIRAEGGPLHEVFDRFDRAIVDPEVNKPPAIKAIADWVEGNRTTLTRRLRKRLEGLNVGALALIDNVNPDSLRVFTLFDEPPSRADWYHSGVALLGDAVHPSLPDLGQGCGLAFEDAEAIARHVCNVLGEKEGSAADKVQNALHAWAEERHTRAAFVVQTTRALAEAVHAGREPQSLRDAMISTFGPPTVLPTLTSIVAYEPPEATARTA